MGEFWLRLYISGSTASSQRAQDHLSLLRAHLVGPQWKVDVIDVLTEPHLAEDAGILATPTLSFDHPGGSKRVVGDLSDTNRILEFLGIVAKDESA